MSILARSACDVFVNIDLYSIYAYLAFININRFVYTLIHLFIHTVIYSYIIAIRQV